MQSNVCNKPAHKAKHICNWYKAHLQSQNCKKRVLHLPRFNKTKYFGLLLVNVVLLALACGIEGLSSPVTTKAADTGKKHKSPLLYCSRRLFISP
jgi:hypothetical protein